MEIFITVIIVAAAVFILYKNIKNKKNGGCNCGSCSSHCPQYKQVTKKQESVYSHHAK